MAVARPLKQSNGVVSEFADGDSVPFVPTGNIAATNVAAALAELDTEKQAVSEKDAANGYLGLDGSGLIPDAKIPSGIARDSEVTTAVSNHSGAADPHGDRAYAAGLFAANDALLYKGAIDCSANPNYPAADAGHAYKVSVAGKIGGGSGPNVEVGDLLVCTADSTSSGNHATVGSFWDIIQVNLDGAVIGPASAVNNGVALFDGTSGRLIKDGGALGSLAALSTITSSEITNDTIVDADINSAAAIALSKLAITGTPDGDHFLRDDGTWATIVDAAVDASAAIALSKLAITGTPDGTKFLRDDGTWEAVPGGGGGTWTLISDSTLGVAAAAMAVTVTGYQVVRFTWLGRTSVSSGSDTLAVRFNADATAKYSSKGAALSTSGTLGIVPGALTNTNRLGIVEGQFALGATGLYTIGRSWGARVNSNGTLSASDDNWISWSGSLTAAATSMSFFPIGGPNLAAGSRLIVEGII